MLEFKNVVKQYPGTDFRAVNDVSFSVSPGTITALLGPNGAGKTTLMKMAAGLLHPTAGNVEIDGIDSVKQLRKYRSLVGLHLGGDLGFYSRSSLIDNLQFFASLAGLPRKRRKQRCLEMLERVGLAEKSESRFEELSHGMKQRMHLARAVVASPRVILLDEPTSGLDPSQAQSIRQLIAQLPANGSAVLISTHQMSEAHQLAHEINIIDHGKLIVSASPAGILERTGESSLEAAYLQILGAQEEGK